MPMPDSKETPGGFLFMKPPAAEAEPADTPPWDLYTVFACLLSGYILIPMLLFNVLLLINPFMDMASQFFIQQLVTLLSWVSMFGFLRFKYGKLAKFLGLQLTESKRYYVWETLLLILVSSSITLGFSFFWQFLEKLYPGLNLGAEPYERYSGSLFWVLAFFAVMMAPLLEELIFRGFIQSTFHKYVSRGWSVFWAAVVFLSLHLQYIHNIKAIAAVMTLGLCFGIWRERTRSLLPGICAHWFNNGLATLALLVQRHSL